MIKQTKDYSIFKIHAANRPLRPKHIQTLAQSISENNLLQYRPIVVDKDMNILDGQHRLEAAKHLQIPIYYEIQENLDVDDMVILNRQVSWTMEDFFNHHIKQARPEYLKLKKFMDAYQFTLVQALAILGDNSRNSSHDKNNKFRAGKYVFPADEMPAIQEKIKSIEGVQAYLKKHSRIMKKHVDQTTFYRALIEFFSYKSVEPEVFYRKMQHCLDMFRPCRTIQIYVDLLKEIYNYHNKKPIDLERSNA